jgi:hypothetical protein
MSYEVTIQTTTRKRRGWKASDGIWANYKQDGNTITIWAVRSNTSRIHDIDHVDFDITVPRNTDLRLTTKTGDIRVTGISGQMQLGSESGSLLVQKGILRGTSRLMTNAGAINYHEAIDPHGTYTFVSTTGLISVILPGDASFHLDARTDRGTITTDFPGVMVTHRTNSAIQSTVGKPPHARVRLRSDSGSIQLYGGSRENSQPLEWHGLHAVWQHDGKELQCDLPMQEARQVTPSILHVTPHPTPGPRQAVRGRPDGPP